MSKQSDKTLNEIETELGLVPGFFNALRKEDPWSFVIKVCALFQSLLALTIAKQFQNPDLFPEFSTLPFAESKAGLITLARKTGAIDMDSFKFLKAMAEIRNKLAHDIKYATFNWKDYYKGLDANQKRAFCSNFTYWLKDEDGLKPSDIEQALEVAPQYLIHNSALFAVYQLYCAGLTSKLERLQNESGRRMLEEKLKEPPPLFGLRGMANLKNQDDLPEQSNP